jgi:hypothetical protein
MEIFQLNEVKRLFIELPQPLFEIRATNWKFGTISEENVNEIKKYQYKVSYYGTSLILTFC